MSVWFEGSNEIDCTLEDVKHAIGDLGEHYVGVTGLLPGLTTVELVEQADDSVVIRTNEGLMTRTNISKLIDDEHVVIEFDEEYQAGSKVTTRSHFVDDFRTSGTGVRHELVISDLTAPGFLGFLYRTFGKSKMGSAFLNAYKTYLEHQ